MLVIEQNARRFALTAGWIRANLRLSEIRRRSSSLLVRLHRRASPA